MPGAGGCCATLSFPFPLPNSVPITTPLFRALGMAWIAIQPIPIRHHGGPNGACSHKNSQAEALIKMDLGELCSST